MWLTGPCVACAQISLQPPQVQQLTQQAQCTEPATRAAQLSAQLEREATALKAVSGERDQAAAAQQTLAIKWCREGLLRRSWVSRHHRWLV